MSKTNRRVLCFALTLVLLLSQLIVLPHQSSRLASASPQELAPSLDLSLPGKNLTEWVLDETTGNIYALAREENQLFFIRYDDMTLQKTINIGSLPSNLIVDQGKIYVGLEGAHQIKVVDIATGEVEQTLATGGAVSRLVKHNQYIYYLTKSNTFQETVMKYDVVAGNESAIALPNNMDSSFYDLGVNKEKNLLYLYSSDFIAVDLEDTSRVVSSIDPGGYNYGRPIIAQGDDLYFGSRRFDATNLNVVKGMYMAYTEYHYDHVLQVRDRVVITNRNIYDKDTYRILAKLPNESSLAAMDSEQNVYTVSYQTISKTKVELPELPYGGHSSTINQVNLRIPITQWVSDSDHIYAISIDNTLLTINKETMTVENESYVGSKPVDIDRFNDKLYVANNGSSSISIANAADPAASVAAQLSARFPIQVAVHEDQIFFTSTSMGRTNNTLSVYSTTTQSISEIKNGIFDIDADSIVISPEKGMLYASSYNQLYGIELQSPHKVHFLVNRTEFVRTLFVENNALYTGTRKYSTDQPARLLATFPDQVIYAKGAYAFTKDAVYDSDSSAKLFDLPFEIGLVDMDDSGSIYLVRGSKDPYFTDNSGMDKVYKFNSIEDLASYMDTFTPGKSVFLDYNNEAGLVSGLVVFEPAENDLNVDHYTLYYMDEDKKLGHEIGQVGKEELDDGLYFYKIYGLYPQSNQTHIAIYAYTKFDNNGKFRASTNYSRTRMWDMPTFLANQVTFDDTDPNPNAIGGVLSWLPANKELPGGSYEVCFGGSDELIGNPIASVKSGNSSYKVTIPSGTAIPDQALELVVIYMDKEGEQAPFYSVTPILDRMTRTPVLEDIKVNNLVGTSNDSITVSKLQAGETVRIYSEDEELLHTVTVPAGQSEVTIRTTNLEAAGGYIYVSLQAKDKAESRPVMKVYSKEQVVTRTPVLEDIKVINGAGTANDSITVSNLRLGEKVRIYSDDKKLLYTATPPLGQSEVTIYVTHLSAAGGNIYLSLQAEGRAESPVVMKSYSKEQGDNSTGGSGGGGGGGGGMPTITNTKVTSTNGKLTLPAGKPGEVSVDEGLTVSIPVNATNKESEITIKKLEKTETLITSQQTLISSIYEISKNFSDNFSLPVTLTFSFNPASLKDGQEAALFYYDETKKTWIKVKEGKINGNKIVLEVKQFATYAVMTEDKKVTVPDQVVPSFSDIAGYWAEADIKRAVSLGIVSGYPNGTFKPKSTVTRAEFAVMLMNMLKPQTEAKTPLTFTDSAKIGAWAQSSVAQAVQAGYIKGNADGTFRPNAEITRAEIAAILAKVLDQPADSAAVNGFADHEDIPAWAKSSVALVKQQGIMQGNSENKFAPNDSATRAEAVTVLLKLFDLIKK